MPRRTSKKSTENARYLQEIRASRASEVFPELEGPMMDWIRRYHPILCDYLESHLEGRRELRAWKVAYTALHEMLGGVWNQPGFLDGGGRSDEAIWSTFDPTYFVEVHLPTSLMFSTLLPLGFLPEAFEHHYVGFLRYLGQRGVMTRDHAEALAVLFRHALRDDLCHGAA